MGVRIRKITGLITVISIVCLLTVSCGTSGKPSYVLTAGEDNGLVAAYRAYFEIDGNTVNEIQEDRYRNLILKNSDYMAVNYTTYIYNVDAKSSNVTKWSYTESGYDTELYNTDKLIKYLKKMDVYYTGDVYIQIMEFDKYTLIEVQNKEGSTVVDISTALFKNGMMVNNPKGVTLKSLDKVYKLA